MLPRLIVFSMIHSFLTRSIPFLSHQPNSPSSNVYMAACDACDSSSSTSSTSSSSSSSSTSVSISEDMVEPEGVPNSVVQHTETTETGNTTMNQAGSCLFPYCYFSGFGVRSPRVSSKHVAGCCYRLCRNASRPASGFWVRRRARLPLAVFV